MDNNTKYPFGAWLTEALRSREIRQVDLARAVGRKRATVSLWCAGETLPHPVTFREVGEALNLTDRAWQTAIDAYHAPKVREPGR